MDKTIRKHIVILPYWGNYLFALCTLAIGVWTKVTTPDPSISLERNVRIVIGISCLWLLQNSIHYSLHPKGIMVHFLFVPIWFFPWYKVLHAEYICRWTTTEKKNTKMSGHGIAFTIWGCPPFNPEREGLNMYQLRHPIGFHFVRFTKRRAEAIVRTYQRYYPKLEFQDGCNIFSENTSNLHAENGDSATRTNKN